MKKYLFLILTIPLVVLIILALPGSKSFRLSGEMILDQIGQNTHIISVQRFKELKIGVQEVQLVDLRGTDEFNTGHLPEAINMPVESLSIADIHRFFKGQDADCVLYSDATYLANKHWVLFRQMGIENIFVLETWPALDSLIINWDSENSRRIMVDEDPAFTFQPNSAMTF